MGFELFGLRTKVYSQLVQFTLERIGYDNHHSHNKPPDKKWGWSVGDVIPEEMVLKIWGFWKRVSWELRQDHGGRESSFCHWGIELDLGCWRCSCIFRISTDRDLRHYKMRRAWGWSQHSSLEKTFKNCVSLLVSKNRSQKIYKPFLSGTTDSAWVLYCIYIVLQLWLISSRYTTLMYLHLYMYCCDRGARSVMVIVVWNGHGNMSSKPGWDWLHFT